MKSVTREKHVKYVQSKKVPEGRFTVVACFSSGGITDETRKFLADCAKVAKRDVQDVIEQGRCARPRRGVPLALPPSPFSFFHFHTFCFFLHCFSPAFGSSLISSPEVPPLLNWKGWPPGRDKDI